MSHRSIMSVSLLSLIVMILAVILGSGLIDVPETPTSPEDPIVPPIPEEYPFDNEIPDGFTLDLERNVLSAEDTVT